MVNCAKCGETISFFKAKYDYTDENGNSINYCSKCNEEFQKVEKKKKEDKIKKEKEIELKKILSINSKWEYKTISIPIKDSLSEYNKDVSKETDKILNALGNEGWELVSTSSVIAHSVMSGGTTTTKFIFSFKRKK